MKLISNGKEITSKTGINVTQLLIEQKVKMPDMVSVELNGRIISRKDFDTTVLREGDKVEFLYFMGGGRGA